MNSQQTMDALNIPASVRAEYEDKLNWQNEQYKSISGHRIRQTKRVRTVFG